MADGAVSGGIRFQSGGIVDRNRENAAALRQGGDGGDVGYALGDARPLVAAEQKQLIADERAAGGAAELVLAERGQAAAGGGVEEIVGIEHVGAQGFEDGALQ